MTVCKSEKIAGQLLLSVVQYKSLDEAKKIVPIIGDQYIKSISARGLVAWGNVPIETVSYLIDKGLDINSIDEYTGQNALFDAMIYSFMDKDAIKCQIDRYLPREEKWKVEEQTQSYYSYYQDLVDLLKKRTDFIITVNKRGRTPSELAYERADRMLESFYINDNL